MEEIIVKNCIGFEWDVFNETKNWKKHAVTKWECEQVFLNKPLLFYEDSKHSQTENRMYVLGQTDEKRKLFIVFTVRNNHIRAISARKKSEQFMSNFKKIPTFKNLAEEQAFWQQHDSDDYIDWSKAQQAQFPNLKPSTKTISLRLPEGLLNEIKILANKEDVPYQSLIKVILAQSIEKMHSHK